MNTPLHICGTLNEVLDNEKDYQEKKTMTMTKNYRNVKIADMLVEKGSDPKLENNLGATVFHLAAKSNSEQLIKYLISKFNHLINYSDKYGNSIKLAPEGFQLIIFFHIFQ